MGALAKAEVIQLTEDRARFIGGSDIAAILGISPWRTAVDVWLEKRGEAEESFDPEREKRLKRGHRLEPIVIEMWQEETGQFAPNRNLRFVHPHYPFLAAQIDFEYQSDNLMNSGDKLEGMANGEAKTVDPRHAFDWGPSGSPEVPAHYLAQVMFGLAITGRAEATLAALIGDDLRCYRFERDEELCAELVRRAVEFWDVNVTMGIAPAIQSKDDAARLVRKFAGFSFEATDTVRELIDRLRVAKIDAAGAKAECERLELEIQRSIVAMADANAITDGDAAKFTVLSGGKPAITWNLQKRSGYTVGPTEFRVMRLCGGKEK